MNGRSRRAVAESRQIKSANNLALKRLSNMGLEPIYA